MFISHSLRAAHPAGYSESGSFYPMGPEQVSDFALAPPVLYDFPHLRGSFLLRSWLSQDRNGQVRNPMSEYAPGAEKAFAQARAWFEETET
jgi:hypothetical protein